MKTHICILLLGMAAMPLMAEENSEPEILPQAFAQRVSPNGTYVMAQDITGSAILYNVETEKADWFGGYYPGNGNCVSNNGVMVGQEMESSRGALIRNGEPVIPKPLFTVLQSSIDAITPQGSRVCGWIQNARGGAMQIPYYFDIYENGVLGEATPLPYPPKDLFNETPQYCNAVYISDDGKTIAGIVQDGSGFYSYPIVYKEDENGNWSYLLPSEPLFNPDHLTIPAYPDIDKLNFPEQPDITNYMTSEMKAEWEKAIKEYETTGFDNPWLNVTYYTGEKGYAEYENAIKVYNQEVNRIIGEVLDQYWKDMAAIGKNARFLPNMALSPDGTTLLADLGISDDEYTSDDSSSYVTYKFDLISGEYSIVESKYEDLIPTQILGDGTIISLGHPYGTYAYEAFILLPEADDYISFVDYMSSTNPSYLAWMDENLDTFYEGIVSGLVSFSEDMSVIAGGNPNGEMISYVIAGANAGVSHIEVSDEGAYRVFNLNGIKILTTKEKSDLEKLPKGIYIVNGKKIKL